jgi:hypothetical protein
MNKNCRGSARNFKVWSTAVTSFKRQELVMPIQNFELNQNEMNEVNSVFAFKPASQRKIDRIRYNMMMTRAFWGHN